MLLKAWMIRRLVDDPEPVFGVYVAGALEWWTEQLATSSYADYTDEEQIAQMLTAELARQPDWAAAIRAVNWRTVRPNIKP
jgi:hypothetical protein